MVESSIKARVDFEGKDVLEIGCGSGKFTLDYLAQANSILGIDPDKEGIEKLKAAWPKDGCSAADFRVADILNLPLPPNIYDVVVFSRSF